MDFVDTGTAGLRQADAMRARASSWGKVTHRLEEPRKRTGGRSNPQRTDACQDTRARNRAVRLARHLNAIGISPT